METEQGSEDKSSLERFHRFLSFVLHVGMHEPPMSYSNHYRGPEELGSVVLPTRLKPEDVTVYPAPWQIEPET